MPQFMAQAMPQAVAYQINIALTSLLTNKVIDTMYFYEFLTIQEPLDVAHADSLPRMPDTTTPNFSHSL